MNWLEPLLTLGSVGILVFGLPVFLSGILLRHNRAAGLVAVSLAVSWDIWTLARLATIDAAFMFVVATVATLAILRLMWLTFSFIASACRVRRNLAGAATTAILFFILISNSALLDSALRLVVLGEMFGARFGA